MKNILELSEETKEIIRNLYNKKRIGGKHTEEKNCLKIIKNLKPDRHKKIIREWKFSIKEEIVLREIKTGEFHVSLNPRKIKEIHEIMD